MSKLRTTSGVSARMKHRWRLSTISRAVLSIASPVVIWYVTSVGWDVLRVSDFSKLSDAHVVAALLLPAVVAKQPIPMWANIVIALLLFLCFVACVVADLSELGTVRRELRQQTPSPNGATGDSTGYPWPYVWPLLVTGSIVVMFVIRPTREDIATIGATILGIAIVSVLVLIGAVATVLGVERRTRRQVPATHIGAAPLEPPEPASFQAPGGNTVDVVGEEVWMDARQDDNLSGDSGAHTSRARDGFDTYRVMIEDTSALNRRRQTVDGLYLSVVVAILIAESYVALNTSFASWVPVIVTAVLGMVSWAVIATWSRTRLTLTVTLNSRYKLLQRLESMPLLTAMGANMFTSEWEELAHRYPRGIQSPLVAVRWLWLVALAACLAIPTMVGLLTLANVVPALHGFFHLVVAP